MRGSSCAPAAAAHSVPATCTSHLVPSLEENHDAREASPRSSPSTDPPEREGTFLVLAAVMRSLPSLHREQAQAEL